MAISLARGGDECKSVEQAGLSHCWWSGPARCGRLGRSLIDRHRHLPVGKAESQRRSRARSGGAGQHGTMAILDHGIAPRQHRAWIERGGESPQRLAAIAQHGDALVDQRGAQRGGAVGIALPSAGKAQRQRLRQAFAPVIEPLALHKPVWTGPSVRGIEYPAIEALQAGVLHHAQDGEDLAGQLAGVLADPVASAALVEKTRHFNAAHAGSVARHMAAFWPWLQAREAA